jgi:hypothetical protein
MTREDVIRQIVARDLQGQGLTGEVVRREGEPLYTAACDNFGTWDTALRYAGISRRRLRAEGDYSRDRVLQQIRRLCGDGYNLGAGRNRRRNPALYHAARRHYGGWKRAMRAAGIDVARLGLRSKPRRLNKRAIIVALQKRHREGRSLRCCHVYREDRGLATAAKHAFSSWWRALAVAGLAPDTRPDPGGPRRWDKQLVIDAIKARQRDGKLTSFTGTRRDDGALVAAARRHFGSWTEALKAATAPEMGAGERPGK